MPALADMPWLLACVWRPNVEDMPTDWEYTVWLEDDEDD